MTRFTFGAWIGLALACAFAATWPFRGDWAQDVANSTMNRPLAHAKTWRIEPNPADFNDLAADPSDLLVIGAARYGKRRYTPDEIARLKVRADGTRRLVVAVLAVGEIVEASAAWDDAWTVQPPQWLGEANCARPTVRRIRYWLPEWKDRLFRAPGSYLERIIAAGFDGVVLGGLDVVASFAASRPSAPREMMQTVSGLALAARALKPGFMVIAENGAAMLADPGYRTVIDGIAVTGLLYASDGSGVRKPPPDEIEQSMQLLRPLQKDGKPIFAIEVLHSTRLIDRAVHDLRRRGVVASIAIQTRDASAAANRGERACPPGSVW
ncbi:MAG: hypothetical protein WBP38_00155 [Hyphomicrobium sp.]|jgi:uncharacterized protein (TIGR01370 family)